MDRTAVFGRSAGQTSQLRTVRGERLLEWEAVGAETSEGHVGSGSGAARLDGTSVRRCSSSEYGVACVLIAQVKVFNFDVKKVKVTVRFMIRIDTSSRQRWVGCFVDQVGLL